jgi:hypothetical protein
VDVAVVSDHYFDVAWHHLRSKNTSWFEFDSKGRSRKHDISAKIYWGCIPTDGILSHLPFGRKWELALLEMQNKPPIDGRELKIRLYRDAQALRDYQTKCLRESRERLTTKDAE